MELPFTSVLRTSIKKSSNAQFSPSAETKSLFNKSLYFNLFHAVIYTVKADLPVTSNFATNTLYGGKFLPARVVGMWRAEWVCLLETCLHATKMMVEAYFCINQQIDRCGIFLPLRYICRTNMPQWSN